MKHAGSAIPAWDQAHYWDPATGQVDTLPKTDSDGQYGGYKDAFCAGHISLADGRILVVGGKMHVFTTATLNIQRASRRPWFFDPADATPSLDETDKMDIQRWYGSPVLLPDGRVTAVSGITEPDTTGSRVYGISSKIEVFDPLLDPIWRIRNSTERFDTSAYAWMRPPAGHGVGNQGAVPRARAHQLFQQSRPGGPRDAGGFGRDLAHVATNLITRGLGPGRVSSLV